MDSTWQNCTKGNVQVRTSTNLYSFRCFLLIKRNLEISEKASPPPFIYIINILFFLLEIHSTHYLKLFQTTLFKESNLQEIN